MQNADGPPTRAKSGSSSYRAQAHLQICRLSCHKSPYFTPRHQKMFGINLKFTKILLEALWESLQHIPGLSYSILSTPLLRGVQRHPAAQNASHKSSGRQNKETGETKFKLGQLILRKIIKIVTTRCYILSSQRSPRPLAGFKGSYF